MLPKEGGLRRISRPPTPPGPTSPIPPPAPALSTSNVQRKRTLQLNESNPSGIDAIIEAAGTVFCCFSRPPLLSPAPSVLSRVGGGSVFPSLWFVLAGSRHMPLLMWLLSLSAVLVSPHKVCLFASTCLQSGYTPPYTT